jgi:hypothetical protein
MLENTDGIVDLINPDLFKDKQECNLIKEGIRSILKNLYKDKDMEETIESVTKLLEEIWNHFSIGKYAKIFTDFGKAEKALYGSSGRYRDHLIHVFNVYFLGLIIFSKCENNKNMFHLLKIQDEPKNIPFQSKYNKWRRLYYLWCLISTFHDIATPIELEKELYDVINKYLDYFQISTENISLKFPIVAQYGANQYFELMASLFSNGMAINSDRHMPSYDLSVKDTSSFIYFKSVLLDAINKKNHSVFGAYFLFRSVEEMFFCGKNYFVDYQ